MTKVVKLAVLRARHDTSVAVIPDQACRELLFANASNEAVFQFWQFQTNDYFDLSQSVMFPWVDVTLGAGDDRGVQVQRAYDASGGDQALSGFDGYVVIVLPGQVAVPNPNMAPGQPPTVLRGLDGGTTGFKDVSACTYPVMASDHTYMAHEAGHVIGFDHTFGVMNNGIDWDGVAPFSESTEYGDPYDAMSSASFGARWLDPAVTHYTSAPTFAGTAIAGWPNPGAFRMGPGAARAAVHFFFPDAITGRRVKHVTAPAAGERRWQRLFHPSSGVEPTLLAIHPPDEPPDGRGRVYVEYRKVAGWDRGLDTAGADLARQAVVVHALAANGAGTGCFYRGRILVPLEGDVDLAVPDQPIVISVTGVDDGDEAVEVTVTPTAVRQVRIDEEVSETLTPIVEQVEHTPCGDVRSGTYALRRTSVFRARTSGFGGFGAPDATSPELAWRVAGQPVVPGPTTLTVGAATIQCTLDGAVGALTLESQPQDAYQVDVTCTATEPGGGSPESATVQFAPSGTYTGIYPPDIAVLTRCISRYVYAANLRPDRWVIPPEEPGWDLDLLSRERLQFVVDELRAIDVDGAAQLENLADLRYGALDPERVTPELRSRLGDAASDALLARLQDRIR